MKTSVERKIDNIESQLKNSRRFSFLTILGLIFIVLKLANIGIVATWSWWLVLLPFLIELGLIAVAIILVLIAIFICK